MNFMSIGDLSQGLRFQYLSSSLKNESNKLAVELATGKAADITKNSGGALRTLGQLRRTEKMLKVYRTSGAELMTQTEGMQTALETIQNGIKNLAGVLAIPRGPATAASNSAGANAALEGMRAAIGAMNLQIAGRGLFSGQAVSSPAVKSADSILDDLQAAATAAGAISSGDIKTVVDAYFDDAAGGFVTSAYLGSTSKNGAVRVSETESVTVSPTASDPEFRAALKGMASAALMTRDILSSNPVARAEVLQNAGNTLLASNDGLTQVRADIGAKQERIDLARVNGNGLATGIQKSIAGLIGVDGYETATRFQATQSSLEALFVATSKLSQFSLTKYIR